MRSARLSPLRRGLWVIAFLAALLPIAAHAKSETPDPAANPALAALMQSGAKFFYLGRFSGLDGWLVVKDGKIQIVYKPENNAYVMVGYLFAANGDNVTAGQVKKLTATNKELAALAATADDLSQFGLPAAPPEAKPAAAPDPSLPPGAQLLKQLDASAHVTLGSDSKAPEVSVVLSLGCTDCKTLWQEFQGPVEKGAVRLRLFPAALHDSEDERAGAELLNDSNAMAGFDQYVNGDHAALAGTPSAGAVGEVRSNTALVAEWHLPADPMLIYRDKSGPVKVVQGVPKRAEDILNDLGAAAAPATGAKP